MDRRAVVALSAATAAASAAAIVLTTAGAGQEATSDRDADTDAATTTTIGPSGSLDLVAPASARGPAPSDYWDGFPMAAAAGWSDPAFFPIGVWAESAYKAPELVALGIDHIVQPVGDGADLRAIGDETGMRYIAGAGWSAEQIGDNPHVVGWSGEDECDMALGRCAVPEGGDPDHIVDVQRGIVEDFRSRDDGRFVHANYGKAVLDLWWNPENMPALVSLTDVASADLYFSTDPNLPREAPASPHWRGSAEVRRAAAYGWTVDRMETYLPEGSSRPTWAFVEVGHPFEQDAAPTATPDQIEAAVWSSIIHGATGITYFNHSFGGECVTQHVLQDCDPAVAERVRSVNADVRAMAPVLNAPTVDLELASQAVTLAKVHDDALWVLATLGLGDRPGPFTMTVPASLDATEAEVVGESRTVPVVGGVLVDRLAAGEHHVYRFPT